MMREVANMDPPRLCAVRYKPDLLLRLCFFAPLRKNQRSGKRT